MSENEITLRPGVLNRLRGIFLQMEGAKLAAEGAILAHDKLRERLNQAVTDACADEGMVVPPGKHGDVDVDWESGEIKLRESSPNGVAALP